MESISISEPIKIRLKGYRTLFRRALLLEKQEKAILGLIYRNNGSYGFIELGTVLGFAVEDNTDNHIRKDVAEIQLFESYLESLKVSHLIDYNSQSIQLTFWGEKAITDDLKYSFYSGNIQIPEFFDIELSNGASNFAFKEIGVEVKLINEQKLDKAWDLTELEAPDPILVNQFHLNRLKNNDEIIFDSIEPLSNLCQIETILEFTESNSSIDVFYDFKLNERLSEEINKIPNNLKADNLKLRIHCKRLVESQKKFLIKDLTDFVSIIDWIDVLERPNIVWDSSSIGLLEKFQVNWNLISSRVPISIIQDEIDDYIDKFDWLELTNRLNLEFILANIDLYPWDVDSLVDRVTLDDFKNHISGIVKLPGIDLNRFYKQVEKDFIRQNFNQLPSITSYITTNHSSELLIYILEYSDAPWNPILVSQKLSLTDIEANFSTLKQNLNFEILIERFISESYDCNAGTFEEVISLASLSDDYKMINRFSKCDLSLTKLQILDKHELIYWGNDVAPGFELNPFQKWSIDTLRTFKSKWGYSESIKYLSAIISDASIIEELKFEWDFLAISKNSRLINQENFFEENKNRLDVNSAIQVFDKNTLKLNLKSLLQLDEESKLVELPVVISKLFNLEDIIEANSEIEDLFLGISSEIDIDQIWLKTPKSFIKENIEDIFIFIESTPPFGSLLTEITDCFEVEEVLESPNFPWDWNNVTQRAIEEDLLVEETLVAFSGCWDWKVLIEKFFDPKDLLFEGRLSEIAALISQAPDEVIEKTWKHITNIYPSHLIWGAINTTENIDVFKWDWNSISSSNKISLDLNTLQRYQGRINWSLLSSNSYLNVFFRNDHEIYGARKQWERHVIKYLSEFAYFWDFKELSKLENITRSESVVHFFKQKWDWDILSSEKSKLLTTKNKDGVLFNERLFQKFEKFINFEVISHRKDAFLNFEILNKFNDKNWDWKALSGNESLKIDKKYLLNELFDKPWDWSILSNNPTIHFSNDDLLLLRDKALDWAHFSSKEWLANSTISELADRAWDWRAISSSRQLFFDLNLLRILSSKENVNWVNILNSKNLHCNENTIGIIAFCIKDSREHWSALSSNQNLIFASDYLLDEYRAFWDWDVLIKSNKIDINSILILRKYRDYLNWTALSSASSFNADISVLNEFKYLLDWKHVTTKIVLNDQILENFKTFIDWKVLSRYSDFTGQLQLIKKHSDVIDFEELENNPTIDYGTSLYIENYLKDNIHKRFVYNLKKQRSNWAGYVYHFTHLTNALEIIKNRQIASRNRALKVAKFSDAAGSVVNRRHDAHDYARFYFRPQTPTQFYNECLGKDYLSDKYDQALNLGLPKCPIPVFFKFSIDEIFNKQFDKCFISNGNLQTNWARIGTLSEMYNLFDFNDVYSTIQSASDGDWRTYINKSQQEFLIRDRFDFSDIHNYEILVRNRSDMFQLKHLLKDYSYVVQKIRIADYEDDIYLNNNKDIEYDIKGNSVSISTNYDGNGSRSGYFEMEIIEGAYRINSGQILSKNGNTIRFYPDINIEFESEPCLKVSFKDQVTNKDPWQIIKYCGRRKLDEITNIVENIKDKVILSEEEDAIIWWGILSINWKKVLYANYLKTRTWKDIALFTMLEDVHSFYEMPSDEEIKKIHKEDILEIINLKQLHLGECCEVGQIYDLKPIEKLEKLEVLRLIEMFEDLSPLYNLNLKLFTFFPGEMPNSAQNVGRNMISEEKKENAISRLKSKIPNCNIQARREDYYTHYYESWGELFDGGGYSKESNFKGIIDKLSSLNDEIKIAFKTKVRHYVLADHTILVVRNYYKYFFGNKCIIDNYLFMMILFLHDIGKPVAFKNGELSAKHNESIRIIKSIWDELPFKMEELIIVEKMLSGDPIGNYFQGKNTLKNTASEITELSNECNMSKKDFFQLFMIYYQCDSAAYTADAGGYKFLEHLYCYESGQKVFDEEAGLLRFSDKYAEMYNRLKNEILKWQ
jgi:hypothetical protein